MPSAFSITLGIFPSITDTAEFVVPSIRGAVSKQFLNPLVYWSGIADANIPKSIPITGPLTFISPVSGVEDINLAKADEGSLAAFRRSVGLNAEVVRGIYMRQTIMLVSSHHCCREKKERKKNCALNETYRTGNSWKNHVERSCNKISSEELKKQNTRGQE